MTFRVLVSIWKREHIFGFLILPRPKWRCFSETACLDGFQKVEICPGRGMFIAAGVKAHHQFNVLFGVHVSHLSRTGMARE